MSNIERAVRKAANAAVKEASKDAQKRLDRICQQYGGKPVHVVESALRRELSRTALDLDRTTLRQWAGLISEGRHIKLDPKDL